MGCWVVGGYVITTYSTKHTLFAAALHINFLFHRLPSHPLPLRPSIRPIHTNPNCSVNNHETNYYEFRWRNEHTKFRTLARMPSATNARLHWIYFCDNFTYLLISIIIRFDICGSPNKPERHEIPNTFAVDCGRCKTHQTTATSDAATAAAIAAAAADTATTNHHHQYHWLEPKRAC